MTENEIPLSDPQCGYVAVVGRPNVGKSTLVNKLIRQKLSITANKAQTTRHAIRGVLTDGHQQVIYVDTPGIHQRGDKALNRILNKTAVSSLVGVDFAIFLVKALMWTDEDQTAWERVRQSGVSVSIVINFVDTIKDKEKMLPWAQSVDAFSEAENVFYISAQTGKGVDTLERFIFDKLPNRKHDFDEEALTDRSNRFIASEFVREPLTRLLEQELPYALTVEIEQFVEEEGMFRIAAIIWVERDSQKSIVIGKGGQKLKDIGTRARKSLEQLYGLKVFLQLWVKVRKDWSNDARALRSLGYDEE